MRLASYQLRGRPSFRVIAEIRVLRNSVAAET
jgi:hypothetical protein